MRSRLLITALLFLLVIPLVSGAAQIKIFFEEKGKIISYYDDYYVTTVNGTAWIMNPTNTTLYNVIIPYNLQPMTLIETSSTNYTDQNQIIVIELSPHQNVSFNYKIVGIPFEDPMDQGRGVFRSAIIKLFRKYYGTEDGRIYSDMMGTLLKGEVENRTTPGHGTRLVAVRLQNPTVFYYNISSIRVIKTRGMDPNRDISTGWLAEWSFPNEKYPKTLLNAGESYDIDILDRNASEGEVYWLSSDVFIPDVFINGSNTVKRLTQDDVQVFEGELVVTLENGTNVSLLEQPMFIQKKISKSVVQPGDRVTVDIIITNLGFETENVWVFDAYPYGFELVNSLENVTGRNITWRRKVPPNTPLILRYELDYVDPNALGIDFFPAAEMRWDNNTMYSQTLSFVRRYVPEKVLYMQKSLRYTLNEEIVVKIELTNLGQAAVDNLVMKEYLQSGHLFREISQAPYAKGVWRIPEIAAGETWTVTYVTEEHSGINLFPEVFGISSSYVLKTLVLENVIRSRFTLAGTNIIEIVGILAIVALPVLYFVLHKREKGMRFKKASEATSPIQRLRKETEMKPEDRISLMLRESRSGSHQHHARHEHYERKEHPHGHDMGKIYKDIHDLKKKSR